ncbi:MAG: phosphoadenylyl-sulfate reductase [Microthrixaceae bacterium]|nr:phosphoadenylyl-sulfate reductase [Microthrixaceae bacterium]MCO5317478.1 phosphoadenylyl-sulfate reductase [Microthrixaceae bacterium]
MSTPTESRVGILERSATRALLAPTASATEAVAWAVERFGEDLCLLCSGQDAVLVDVALGVDPRIEVVFIDTGFHFDETINTMLAIAERYEPRMRVVAPWRHLPGTGREDFCCSQHKVEQLDAALAPRRAWLSGLRRADSPERAQAPIVEVDRRGKHKVNPLVAWTDREVREYEKANDIIVNPLRDRGYPSIGCKPCTSPVAEGEHPRAGRWAGSERTECGLHL